MSSVIYTGTKGIYKTHGVLGKGGEGEVSEIVDRHDLVLKSYNEPLSDVKIRKLRLMVTLNDPELQSYAAWPEDVVSNERGEVCGFTMKKLASYVPMHMLFSPLDRKKLFPDKGYNFLIHVARNLALAFARLHSKGIIIGDINEGNLLVNSQGMVAMIDCDSFQLKNGSEYFYCEVGVPRYTAPELYGLGSFSNKVRTENTDCFGLAILLFQLLFLGRHPFAGRNLTNEDISEEQAIRQYLFAYSIKTKGGKLAPPPDALPIKILSEQLTGLFHDSFEQGNKRTSALKWVQALDQFNQLIKVCDKSKIHLYPDTVTTCPWCDFKERKNIVYFLDDSLLRELDKYRDIDSFVNGLRIERLSFPPIHPPHFPDIVPEQMNNSFRYYRTYQIAAVAALSILGVFICYGDTFKVVCGAISVIIISQILPWSRKLKKKSRGYLERLAKAREKLDEAVASYNKPKELPAYNNACTKLVEPVNAYRKIPQEYKQLKQDMEERLYNEQMNVFLRRFLLEDHSIPGIAAGRKKILHNAGIINAADITKLKTYSVQGIGPKFTQDLFAWQRQMSSDFTYHPNNVQLQIEHARILKIVDDRKSRLSDDIRKAYTNLLHIKAGIITRQDQLKHFIHLCYREVAQATVNVNAFKELTGV